VENKMITILPLV